MQKVGIVGYNQVKLYSDANYGRYEMIFEAVRGAIDDAGLKKKDITTVISCTNDYYEGRTISNCFTVEVGGGYLADESKVEMDGAHAVLYGLMRILSGSHKLAVVWGGSMASCFPYHSARLYETDPTWERPLAYVNDITSSGFQMRAYMEKYGVSVEDVAEVAVKNRQNAARNPLPPSLPRCFACLPSQSPLSLLHLWWLWQWRECLVLALLLSLYLKASQPIP